jgi:hypothetical protein
MQKVGYLFTFLLPAVSLLGDTEPVVKSLGGKNTFAVPSQITLQVEHLSDWASKNDLSKLRLFLDRRMINGLKPNLHNPAENAIDFDLLVLPEDREAWAPALRDGQHNQPIALTIGPNDTKVPFQSTLNATLQLATPRQVLFLVGLVASIIGLLYLGAKSNLLRFTMAAPAAPGHLRFSLGKTQILTWTVVIVASYIYIYLITGAQFPLDSTILILLGTSAATTLAAATVDDDRQSKEGAPVSSPSRGFLRDLISDANGIAVSRLQFVVWTLVLVGIFVVTVIRTLTMPTFDASLLTLMGISSGTYVGLKLPT